MQKLGIAAFLLGLFLRTSPLFAQVESDRLAIGLGGGMGDYSFVIEQLPSSSSYTDYTGGWFDFSFDGVFATITGKNLLLDEGSDWYFVREGDQFSAKNVSLNLYSPFIETKCDGCSTNFFEVSFSPLLDFLAGIEDGPSDFYLGFATNGPPRTVYGWAKLEILLLGPPSPAGPFELKLLDSRVAYNSSGVIVGTSTAIPEPSSQLLCSIVAFLFSVRRSGRRRIY